MIRTVYSLTASCLVGALLVGRVAAASALPSETTSLAELGVGRQALVSAGLGADDDRYHARAAGEGFLMVIPAQGLTAVLAGSGIEVRGSNGEIGMRLVGWGCAADRAAAGDPHARAEANRVEFLREGMIEWYVAGPMGVEQGFTVAAPRAGCEAAEPLVIELAIAGSPLVGGDGRSLVFPEVGILYRGLIAVDADGRELLARLELTGSSLEVRTEVADARWPVTVDPMFEVAKLLASDGAVDDSLGLSIGASGSTLVVGAVDFFGAGLGSAYVFTEPFGGWAGTLNESAKLLASDGAAGDNFGWSVGVSSGTVVVGSFGDADNGEDSGSAYVFTEPVGGWAGTLNETAKLLPSDGAADDEFGNAVAVSESTVVVGALKDDHNGNWSGSAYVFTEPVGGWAGTLDEDAKLLASDGAFPDLFGRSVAVSGSTVVIGTGGAFPAPEPGKAYVFTEPVGGWAGTINENAKLVASDGFAGDWLGWSVAVSGRTVVTGAPNDQVADDGDEIGSAYVFTEPEGGWSGILNESAKLLASDGAPFEEFGDAVAISDGNVVVGARRHEIDGDQLGAAYLFIEPVGGWVGTLNESAQFLASDGTSGDFFGESVTVSGETVFVGAQGDDDNGSFSGSAYVHFVLGPLALTLPGDCPGPVTVTVENATPDGPVAIVYSPAEGESMVPVGACAGTPLALDDPSLLKVVAADANGAVSLARMAPPGACGLFVQVVDISSCSVSNVAQLGVGCAAGDRYEDRGDGTVLDCNTGVVWLEDASCAELPFTDVSGRADWDDANAAAAALADGTCGLTDGSAAGDWRLPTAEELCSAFVGEFLIPCPAGAAPDSLIDSSVGPPTVVNTAGDGPWTEGDAFVGVQSSNHWSATEWEVAPTSAWVANLLNGQVSPVTKSANGFVWPVRGGE